MTKYISATQARKNFFGLLELARSPGMTIMVTHQDKQPVVMMSVDEWEGWLETLDILSSEPDVLKDIRKAEREMAEGKTISLEELERKYLKKKSLPKK